MENHVCDALQYAMEIRDSIKRKSDVTKAQTNFLFCSILTSTVFSPVLILLPVIDAASKYLPAFLTACAALASYWLQLRKPQERWVIYRTAQREIEYAISQYNFGLGYYSDSLTKDSTLAERVSKRALQLHYEWLPVVPKIEEIQKVETR